MLRLCPACRRRFDDAGFCPFDGTALLPGTAADRPAPAPAPEPPAQVPGAPPHPGGVAPVDAGPSDLPAHDYDKLVGQTLDGRYAIEARIGEGSMGVVFRARHVVIERPLAIKVLKRDAMRDAATIRRFIQEAKAASRIGHPNIVEVTDFGTTPDGMTYSVMELVAGHTLGTVLRLGAPFAPPRALRIATQIARAIAAAHDKGIVHRDLEPDNVFLLERDGRPDFVKIVDFGIAKVTPPSGQAAEPRLTRAGSVFGTPAYMAPEQAAGRGDTDGRVDIYALGVILYEMICGRVPHRADRPGRTLAMQRLDPIEPPSKLRPDLAIAPALEAIVMHALATQREQRYQTMGELLDALEAIPPPVAAVSGTGIPVYTLAARPPGADPSTVPTLPAMPLRSSEATSPALPATLPDPVPARSSATTRRSSGEPEPTTDDPPRANPRVRTEAPAPARARRLSRRLLVALILGGTAGAVGLVIERRRDVVDTGRDADLVVPAGDARTEQAPAGAEPDATERVVLPAPDAGVPGPPGISELPNQRGTVLVQVLTRPAGASLYDGTHYRGSGGTELEAPLGAKRVITCRQPGYKPGTVEVNFTRNASPALCVLHRIKICIDGIKNPFDDCEIEPPRPATTAGSPDHPPLLGPAAPRAPEPPAPPPP